MNEIPVDSFGNVMRNGVLTDPRTNNTFVDGYWMSPDKSKQFINNQWYDINKTAKPAQQPQGSFNPQQGYGWQLLQFGAGQETFMQQLRGQQSLELQRLDLASKQQLANQEYQLRMALQQGDITQAKYELDRKIAQQESEFARTLAQRQLEFKHQQEIEQINAKIAQGAEMREERELQARLAANPQDWVAYEFYKRAIAGGPQPFGANGGQSAQSLVDMNGTEYPKAPPAYSDQTAQSLATNLFNPTGFGNSGQPAYNPTISGTGVFGTQIEAPNTFTRGEASSMSDAEISMLTGLLQAGIDMGNGRRTSIDAADYFDQAQRSWIPTLAEGVDSRVNYS